MDQRSEKITFAGADGEKLAARLDLPEGKPQAYALWAHCFSCTKDIFAASRVAGGLTAHGIAVLRFDFTGLGASEGDFANTNFSSNVGDLVAAADHLRDNFEAPKILIGHSLGGAAVLAGAGQVPEAEAVCTIGAPADPAHVAHLFQDSRAEIEEKGRGGGASCRAAVPHQETVPGRHRKPKAGTGHRINEKSAAGFPFARRRHRRYRQRGAYFPGRQAPEELRLPGRCRPPVEPQGGRRLCRRRHRYLGGAVCLLRGGRRNGAAGRDRPARHRGGGGDGARKIRQRGLRRRAPFTVGRRAHGVWRHRHRPDAL